MQMETVVLEAQPIWAVIVYLVLSTVVGIGAYGVIRFLWDLWSGGRRGRPPFDATGWTLLVDGSNFAHRGDEVRLRHLMEVLASLESVFLGAEIVVLCDANLRHKLAGADRRKFIDEVKRPDGRFHETHGKSADEVLLQRARSNSRCIVVSNDRFAKGDEPAARIGVPLLRVFDDNLGLRPAAVVNVFRNPNRPFNATTVAVRDLLTNPRN